MNSYDLSRQWFDWSFENPEKISPGHSAIYFFAIEHCNRLGWKDKFGFPSQMAMEAVGIKNWKTYKSYLDDLVKWGFINMIETSKNQYSSNIIAIVKNTKASTKALDKALSKHSTKHSQSTVSIIKQTNKEQETINNNTFEEFYFLYPKHIDKKPSSIKFETKVKQDGLEKIMEGLKRWKDKWKRESTELKFIPSPEVWLNKERYNDEPEEETKNPTSDRLAQARARLNQASNEY